MPSTTGETILAAVPEIIDDTSVIPTRTGPLPVRRLQLDYIDGMRALAALYIVVHHGLQTIPSPAGRPNLMLRFFGHGQEMVAVFLAISGFCLALPQAQRREWKVDAKRFLRRRAQRILPPYYAAVVIAIGANMVQAHYGFPFRARTLWTHCLLIQNWMPGEMYTLDGPLWSVALELQIYLLFPIVILLRRKLGPFVTLALGAVTAFASMWALHGNGRTVFIAYFSIGVFFSEAAFRPAWRRWMPWCMAVAAAIALSSDFIRQYVPEALWAIVVGALMAWLAPQQENPIRKLLSLRPLVFVGVFSYSIYLIHSLFLGTTYAYFHFQDASFGSVNDLHKVVVMGIAAALSIPAAYLFHRWFELPFMSVKRQKVEARVVHA